MFVADGGECLAAQSYAKNMGLYGERVGALSIVSSTPKVPGTMIYHAFDYKIVITLFAKNSNMMKP